MSLFSDLMKLESDIVGGADVATLWADFKALGDSAIGPAVMQAAPGEDVPEAAEKVRAACETRLRQKKAAAPVGKIGDGKILELVMKFLPMILALFGK